MKILRFAAALAVILPMAIGQQFNRATASMTIDGNNGPLYPMSITARTSTTSTIMWAGAPGAPFVFARSGNNNLAPGTGVYGGDYLDIPVNPAYQVLADGYANPNFQMNAQGNYSLAVVLPGVGTPPTGLALGFHQAYQSLVFDFTSASSYHLTAATRVDVTQGPTITSINLGDESELNIAFPAGMIIPYYGNPYTSMTVGSNGYIYAGATYGLEYYASLGDVSNGPPRIFGYFSDMDTANGGTERYIIDTAIPGMPGLKTFKMEFNGVGDYGTPGYHHTFSVLMDNTGYMELGYGFNCAQSVYDTMVGITPGINCQTPHTDLRTIVSTTGAFGTPGQAFWDWFGDPMANAYYPQTWPLHPFSLAGYVLHFQPIGSGTTAQQSNQYWMY